MSMSQGSDVLDASMDDQLEQLMAKLDAGLDDIDDVVEQDADAEFAAIVDRAMNGCDAPDRNLVSQLETEEAVARRAAYRQWDTRVGPLIVEGSELLGRSDVEQSARVDLTPVQLFHEELASRCRIQRAETAGRAEPAATVCALNEEGRREALYAEMQRSIEGLIEIRNAPSALAGEALQHSRLLLSQQRSVESALLSAAIAELDAIAEMARSALLLLLSEGSTRGLICTEAAEFASRRDLQEERRVAFGYTTRYALGEREAIARATFVAGAAVELDAVRRDHEEGSHEVHAAVRELALARERRGVEAEESDIRAKIERTEASTRTGEAGPWTLQLNLLRHEAAGRAENAALREIELAHFSQDCARGLALEGEVRARAVLASAFSFERDLTVLCSQEQAQRIAVRQVYEGERAEILDSFVATLPKGTDPESSASNAPSPNSVTHGPKQEMSGTLKSSGEEMPRRASAIGSSTTQSSAGAEPPGSASAASPPAAHSTMPPQNLSPVHEASPVEALAPAHTAEATGVSSPTVSSAGTTTPEGFSSSTSTFSGAEAADLEVLPNELAQADPRPSQPVAEGGTATSCRTPTAEDISPSAPIASQRATVRGITRTAAAWVVAHALDRAVHIDALCKVEATARDRVRSDERAAMHEFCAAESSARADAGVSARAASEGSAPPREDAAAAAPAVADDRGAVVKRRDIVPHESAAEIMGGPPNDPDTFTQPPSQSAGSRPSATAGVGARDDDDDPVSDASDGVAPVTQNTIVAPLPPPESPRLIATTSGKVGRSPAPPRERTDTTFTMSFEKECDKLLAQLKGLEKLRKRVTVSDEGAKGDRKAMLGSHSKSSNSMLTSRSHSLMNRLIQKQPGLSPIVPRGDNSPQSHKAASEQATDAVQTPSQCTPSNEKGDGDGDVHPDDPQARSKVVALAKEEAQRARKKQWLGGSERHPAFVFLDVSFVLLSFLSCIGALFQVHPRAEELEDSILSEVALAAYNAFVTIFTIAWVVSRFFLAKRKGDWEIVDDLPTIRSMYVRTWFAYDLLFTIPVDFVFVGWQWEVYGWMQLRHFLRLVRIFNLGSSHNPLLSSRLWFRFMSFCCFMVLTMHTLGCIFWALEPSWSYEESLYWAVATVTSVGYGDVVPRTTGGRVYVCFAMFFGIAMLSTMTAFATSFLTDKDKLQQEEESKKQMMYAMLEYYDVPWSVQKEVIAAVPALLDADNESEFKKMTAKLPPFVAHKIECYINVKMLRTVPIFADIDDMEALMDLSNRLTQQFYPAGEAITEQGASDRAMHFIIRGVVELVVLLDPDDEDGDGNFEAVVLGTLAPGSFFGEETLFEERERPETAQTISVVEVLTLTYDAFAAFTETHPGTSATISDSLRRQQLHRAIDEGARGSSETTKRNPLVGASAFSAV